MLVKVPSSQLSGISIAPDQILYFMSIQTAASHGLEYSAALLAPAKRLLFTLQKTRSEVKEMIELTKHRNTAATLTEVSRLSSCSNESPKIVLSGGPKHLQQHHHHHHHHRHRNGGGQPNQVKKFAILMKLENAHLSSDGGRITSLF